MAIIKSILTAGVTLILVILAGCSTGPETGDRERLSQITLRTPVEIEGDVRLMESEATLGAPLRDAPAARPRSRDDGAPAAGLSRSEIAAVPLVKQAAKSVPIRAPAEPLDRENYGHYDDNPVKLVAEHPVSTFSIDVDTGSYANVRRMLNGGRLPRRDAVRVEELINYFDYDYPLPADRDTPFTITTELAPAPWNADRVLLHIGVKGYDVPRDDIPASNLVFLIDVSGSMRAPNKLDLLKNAMKLLTRQLRARDRVAMVVYAGASGVVLESTPGDAQAKIHRAIDDLYAGGSTNGAAGIRLAYAMARQHFIQDGVNRIILATDGDFNVGTVNFEALKDLVTRERVSGVTLTTLGFGAGNYNDHLMEQLADAGNGNYAYIDTLNEARKVLVDELGATLFAIARDVKIQIEFNPGHVAEYRLIGYENRLLNREDFNNDKVDAGDVGAGHSVTALYELTLTDAANRSMDPLRYGAPAVERAAVTGELAFLKLRYKPASAQHSSLMTRPILKSDIRSALAATSANYRFAAAVAGFGQIMRGGARTGRFHYPEVIELAMGARGDDPFGYRGEFVNLVRLAQSL